MLRVRKKILLIKHYFVLAFESLEGRFKLLFYSWAFHENDMALLFKAGGGSEACLLDYLESSSDHHGYRLLKAFAYEFMRKNLDILQMEFTDNFIQKFNPFGARFSENNRLRGVEDFQGDAWESSACANIKKGKSQRKEFVNYEAIDEVFKYHSLKVDNPGQLPVLISFSD